MVPLWKIETNEDETNKYAIYHQHNQPISSQYCVSYKNQSVVLFSKTNDWFLYEMQYWAEMG